MPYINHQKAGELARLAERIPAKAYTPIADLRVTAWVTREPVPYAQRTSGKELSLKPGDKWGELFDCAWFHFTGTVPESAAGQPVVLLIDINGEACVFNAQGEPVQGLTNINSEFDYTLGKPGKRVVRITDKAAGGETIDLWADAGCNDLFGRVQENGTLKEASIALLHPNMLALGYDAEVLGELMQQLPKESARHQRIWAALYRAGRELNDFTEAEAAAARAILAPELAKRGGDASLTISAIGHAHIDLAWLWPLRETIRKGARTFSTVLMNMERYPDYVFGASQPQLYQWMKEHYPGLYARIKQRVAEGRWEVQGAMWVEADANVPSGESLARQILFGKRFFRQEFGIDVKTLWLPDVFGYSGALPQLMRKAGVPYFMTQKLSWSEVNHHPHHTYLWQGIDGSEVLAHMPPEDTYNSSAAPRAIAKAERSYLDKEVAEGCLLLFGIGDGGGGPGEEHLERLARERDLNGLSPVVQEPSERLFERLAANVADYHTWQGELYLEKHQGTYTTQGRNKRYNRRMELALRDAEWTSVAAMRLTGAPYPAGRLEELWKETLLYQFHDILPGSSIGRVYEESVARYAHMLAETEAIRAAAEEGLTARMDTAGLAQPGVVWNPLSWERDEFVNVEGAWRRLWAPSLGYAVTDLAGEQAAYTAPTATETSLENERLRVTLNADGTLASVFDKENDREVLASGEAGNVLTVYHDSGDAWDYAMHYRDHVAGAFKLCRSEARVDGPRGVIRQEYAFGDSTLTQEIVLTAESRRLDFVTRVDWRENGRMLRTAFPTNVVTNEATCEIQFGNLRRPTHSNTTWAQAQFEVCAHKWVDLSERGYGVALLNDCKYGHYLKGHTLDLHLLRSPSYPDPQADRAVHEFTYSLLPHAGDYVAGGVLREAHQLNSPLRVTRAEAHAGELPRTLSVVRVSEPGVVVEAVKKAEESDAVVVRLYEAIGARTAASMTVGLPAQAAALTDLLEENPTVLAFDEGAANIAFGPFEVHTVRVE